MGFLLEPKNWLGLSLCVGLDLIQIMDPDQQLGLQLKWPNDIWVKRNGQHHKLAGILIETITAHLPEGVSPEQTTSNMASRYCVVGMGVNLQAPLLNADAQTIPPLGLLELGSELSATDIIVQMANQLPKTLKRFELAGFAPFQSKFEALNALQGLDLFISDGTRGVCRGVNAQGELMLFRNGELQTHNNLELSVRPFNSPST